MNTQQAPPDAPAGPEKRRGRWLLWLLTLILIAAAGFGGRWYANDQADKDKAALQKQVSDLKAQLKTIQEKPVRDAIEAWKASGHFGAVTKYTLARLQISGDYASATAVPITPETDDALVVLKRTSSGWTVIYGPATGPIEFPDKSKVPAKLLIVGKE